MRDHRPGRQQRHRRHDGHRRHVRHHRHVRHDRHHRHGRISIVALAALLASGGLAAAQAPGAADPPATGSRVTAIEYVRVFDGAAVYADRTVVIRDDRIAAFGPAGSTAVPADAERVDGRGLTLLPGLIDAHTHSFGDALERALDWGVTTELDMFNVAAMAQTLREQQAKGQAGNRADLFSAGTLVTAAGGHGTQFGLPIPTLERAEDAAAFVAERVAEGSDYIKIVIENGSVIERDLPTLDAERVAAVIAAAHDHDKLAVVHVSTLEGATTAIEAGADGLVHLHHDGEHDQAAEAALVRLARERGVFVVPTLSVLESLAGTSGAAAMAEDPELAAHLTDTQKQGLRSGFGRQSGEQATAAFARMLARARAMEEAGVPVLAGTDSPNPGTAHGVSMHRELELLVRAGLSPTDALAAATSRTAKAFGLADRGRIEEGAKANLVLVEADPTSEITATRDIVAVWKDGVRHEPAIHGQSEASVHPNVELGLFGRFDGSLDAPYGAWMPTTDQLAGGKSTVEVALVDSGADGTVGAIEMSGELAAGYAFPWSGVLFGPGAVPLSDAVDVSGADRIVFWARAPEGETPLAVMLFAQSFGQIPRQARVELSSQWQRFEVPLEAFGTQGADVTGVVFSAVARGPFTIQLDEVSWTPRQ
ncbi:MAG TPA: amidohydrolase family protein [Thermoanaerobaculia bacterium]|nr:amidohydrolase family protein [Thermoanaerobaculia bacterium]